MPLTDDLVISSSTALAISENLLAILNTIIQSLPEHELRKLRSTIEQSVHLADDLLYNLSVSSTFHMLNMNDVSAARNANVYATSGDIFTCGGDIYTPADPASSRGPTNDIVVNRTLVPPPSPASLVTSNEGIIKSPTSARKKTTGPRNSTVARNKSVVTASSTAAETHDKKVFDEKIDPDRPFKISGRPRVGVPDYRLHPKFVSTGIPGPYSHPPIDTLKKAPGSYYVIAKGLYVGIFCNWIQCGPWVKGIDGSIYLKVDRWEEAMALYNDSLAAGTCEVLN